MKWFLIGLVCVACSIASVRGDDAATVLDQQAEAALSNNDFAGAAKTFKQIIDGYPNTPTIDLVHLKAGYAYYRANDYVNAIATLSKEIAKDSKPELRPIAFLYTGLAQLAQAQKLTDKPARNDLFSHAAVTFSNLIDFITANPAPENTDMMEDAIYYRVLAEYQKEDYDSAIKDLDLLLKQYPASLRCPDYNLLKGSFYAAQASDANIASDPKITADQRTTTVQGYASKALDAFSRVTNDPNALVQGNDAHMRRAEVLYMIAPLDNGTDGYQKALDEFRQVRRKDDMIPVQQDRLNALKANVHAQLQNSFGGMADKASLLIEREEGRLSDLQKGADPIIQALIRIAECYTSMKQGDEARTVLHRLAAIRSTLTPDQQQEIDFQIIYSYVLGQKADKADAALTDYLAKHPGDKAAQGISYEMASDLIKPPLNDYKGALAQAERSLRDFPDGPYVADAIALKADALRRLGRLDEAQKVIDDYVKANPKNPAANRMLLTKGQTDTAQGDLNAALADFQKVKDNPDAGKLVSIATAAYIQTLQSLKRFDDVIKESATFADKYPNDNALPSVLVLGAVALDKNKDPRAVPALQDVAKRFPKAEAAPYALFYIVNIYQRDGNVANMIQAADEFRAAYPGAYAMLLQVADAVSGVAVKQKKFDQAVGEYQPLIDVPMPEIASAARNKIGDLWLQAAKAMGAYQSLQQQETRDEALKRLTSAEQAYLGTLKNFPAQLVAVGEAFDGLNKALLQRRSWGLLKDDGFEEYLGKLTTDLTTAEMQLRVELARAGLPFIEKNGAKLYQQALDRFKKVVDANPNLALTRQETSQYGELLVMAKAYPLALQIYNALLSQAAPTDQLSQADAYYGLGSTYLAQGDVANAKIYFTRMTSLPNGAAWHPHILDARYGLALAGEQSSLASDNDSAKQIYATLMQSPQASYVLQAKSMIGYGRLLEKAGITTAPAVAGTIEYAVHYYQQVHTLFGPAVPELSAEGLFDAGQVYEKANDKADAQKQYNALINTYGATVPDWAAKAKAELSKLGP